jgi:hypothetical protein
LESGAEDSGSDGCMITDTRTRSSEWLPLLAGLVLLGAARRRSEFLR